MGLQCFKFYDSSIAVKWMPLHWNQVEQWVHYETCCYQSGTVFFVKGHVILNNCDWWTWTRAFKYESEPKWQPPSSTFRMKTQDVTNFISHKSDDHFGMQHPRCCMSSSCIGPSCQWIALHGVSAVALHVAVREKCPGLFENSGILCYNATTHSVDTVKNAGQHWGWKLYGTFPVLLNLVQVTTVCFPNWSICCMRNNLQTEMTFWQQFSVMWYRLVCQVMPTVSTTLHCWQQTIDNLRYYFQGCFEFIQVADVVPCSLGMQQ
jgi:hypothetical protein